MMNNIICDPLYKQCLIHEVEFQMSGDMDMVINPNMLYNNNKGDDWNDSMAYLSVEDKGNISINNTHVKSLLKCGFVVTGRPKKVWALNLEKCTISIDNQNNKWFQIGSDMLSTEWDDLTKYRTSVNCAVEYGIDKVIPKTANNKSDVTSNMVDVETDSNTCITNIQNTNECSNPMNEGEFCCAGVLCGKAKESTTYIVKSMIRHRCCVCKKGMHGGICGAEAATILMASECSPSSVICFLCIAEKGETKCFVSTM